MTYWTASTTMPAGLFDTCREVDCLFQSEEWASVLERGLRCSTIYVFDEEYGRGASVSRFRAGPFQIGYLGFPIGGLVGSEALVDDLFRQMREALSGAGLVALRIPVSAFGQTVSLDLPFEPTPETAIVDLQNWSLSRISKNRRRDVNKSLRAGLDLIDTTDHNDSEILYELYQRTLERKRGSLRYTPSYFSELIRLSRRHANLRVLVAKLGELIAAFTVVARHGKTAYYLHGAFDWEMREYIPSAMLLNEAINWAKCEGCQVFNLMSSPPGQESLIRYKEHWGAETREHRTYTLPVKSTYPLFRAIERLYRTIG